MRAKFWLVMSLCFFMGGEIFAAEPNEDFGQATILGAGVLSATDTLTPGTTSYPDTVLGIRDMFGEIYFFNDDDSPVGDGRASGVAGASTNSGSIDFAVSGYPDEFFFGDHGQFGEFEVFVDVYDFFGDPVDSFSEVRTLQPGTVEDFSYSNFEWISGSYDVYIDNTIGPPNVADVDFYTFTALTPVSSFSAEVTQTVSTSFDSVLGWFNSAGVLIETDDDDAGNNLSLIEGIVPAGGKLTFAVSGYDDFNFEGAHSEDAEYTLELTLGSAGVAGDFDSDVDGRDFLRWQRGGSPTPYSAADLTTWRNAYPGALVGVTAVPEPTTLWLVAMAAYVGLRPLRRQR